MLATTTRSQPPLITDAEREKFGYLLLEANGALAGLTFRPARYQTWWEMACEQLGDALLDAVLPVAPMFTPRYDHSDIAGMSAAQRVGESRLANLRLSMEEFGHRVLGRRVPSEWVTQRYLALRGSHADR